MPPLKTYQRVEARLVREQAPEPYNRTIDSPAAIASLVRHVQDADREKFLVLHLDSRRKLICLDLVAVGTLNASMVHPREVLKTAL